MSDEILTVDAGRAMLRPNLLEQVFEQLEGVERKSCTLVSHPVQMEIMMRQGICLHRAFTPDEVFASYDASGPKWIQTLDLPMDLMRIETPKGLVIIKNLSTEDIHADTYIPCG